MTTKLRLYLVKCRGMQYATGNSVVHGVAYVLARTTEEAYRKVRAYLDKHDIGFSCDRELQSVELVAESADYPECSMRLFL